MVLVFSYVQTATFKNEDNYKILIISKYMENYLLKTMIALDTTRVSESFETSSKKFTYGRLIYTNYAMALSDKISLML